jgi:hypothetical protein
MQHTQFWQDIFTSNESKIQSCLPDLDISLTKFTLDDIVETYYEQKDPGSNSDPNWSPAILVVELKDGRFASIDYDVTYTTGCCSWLHVRVGNSLEQIERFGIGPYWRGYLGIVLRGS